MGAAAFLEIFEDAAGELADVAEALGCKRSADALATARSGVEKIRELNAACGIPKNLREVGVKEETRN